ncbi:MAG: hypothetical protein JF616_00100 [Fibrobacteres bacterium]|nr:hypothetical protein [Fibrobacterota bacterium]
MVGRNRQGGRWGFLIACLLLQAAVAGAASIDHDALHHAYNEGDFDAVLKLTDPFTNGKETYSRSDSAFVFKHLAVVYSANPKTREKGKYYMYRLLEMLPSAELVDMYVSDEVDRLFDKVRKEFKSRQKNFGVDTTLISLPEKEPAPKASVVAANSAPPPEAPKASGKKRIDPIWYWVAGGGVVVGAGIATVLLMQPSAPEGKTYVISGN